MRKFFSRLLDYWLLRKNKNRNPYDDGYAKSIRPILRKVMKWTIGITAVLFFALLIFFDNENRSFAFFTAAAVVGAYYISGCALGFLFAIPKSFQTTAPPRVVNDDGSIEQIEEAAYKDNTSLEEISDWLTKIIIGLSLTQFHHIQNMLEEAAGYISSAFQLADTGMNFFVFSYAMIVLFGVAGMVSGYLWTRIEFRRILTESLRELQKRKKFEEMSDTLIRQLNDPQNVEFSSTEVDQQTPPSNDSAQIELINKIVQNTPVGPADDLQKGRWGGSPISNNRKITAEVSTSSIPSLYKVKIKVSSVDGSLINRPVAIILHDSFEPMIRILDANAKSEVFIQVIAYEAFTIGAICDAESLDKFTRLELDLNMMPNLPQGFYWS